MKKRSGRKRVRDMALSALVGAHPVPHHLVEVPAQDLLIAEQELVDHSGLKHRMRRLKRVSILEAELFESESCGLLRKAFPRVLRRSEIERSLEQVAVGRQRPVMIGQIPARLPNQDREVGEELK